MNKLCVFGISSLGKPRNRNTAVRWPVLAATQAEISGQTQLAACLAQVISKGCPKIAIPFHLSMPQSGDSTFGHSAFWTTFRKKLGLAENKLPSKN